MTSNNFVSRIFFRFCFLQNIFNVKIRDNDEPLDEYFDDTFPTKTLQKIEH